MPQPSRLAISNSAFRRVHEQRKQGDLRRSVEASKRVSCRMKVGLGARAQVVDVGGVRDIAHDHMGDHHLEAGVEDPRPATEQVDQRQRVLSAREPHQQAVALVDQSIVEDRLLDLLLDFPDQSSLLCSLFHLSSFFRARR